MSFNSRKIVAIYNNLMEIDALKIKLGIENKKFDFNSLHILLEASKLSDEIRNPQVTQEKKIDNLKVLLTTIFRPVRTSFCASLDPLNNTLAREILIPLVPVIENLIQQDRRNIKLKMLVIFAIQAADDRYDYGILKLRNMAMYSFDMNLLLKTMSFVEPIFEPLLKPVRFTPQMKRNYAIN